jgi:glycyl-tRNA synthetase (class II)
MGVVVGCWGLEWNWSTPNHQKLSWTQIINLSSTFTKHVCFAERMWEGERQWDGEIKKLLEPRRWKECEGAKMRTQYNLLWDIEEAKKQRAHVKENENEREMEITRMKKREQNPNWLLFEVWHLDGWMKKQMDG